MSYKQRVLRFHRIYSTYAEEFLAWSICVPFTLMLYGATVLNQSLPNRVQDPFLKVAKYLCLFPMNCLKGMASILLTPLVLFSALRNNPPSTYDVSKAKVAGLVTLALPVAAQMIYFAMTVEWAFMMPLICIAAGGRLRRNNISPNEERYLTFITAFIATINAIFALASVVGFALQLSTLLTSTMPLWLLGTFCLAFWLEGSKQLFTSLLANTINGVISSAQFILLRFKINTFQNKQTSGLDNITEVPSKDLFISESNHAFTLEELEGNINFGLYNWNDNDAEFNKEDFLKLQQHRELPKYPQLQQFIENNRNYYLAPKELISKESLDVLAKFGQALGQDPAHPEYNIKLVAAKEAFEAQLKKVTPKERAAIENLKITIGSGEPPRTLKNALEEVAKGANVSSPMCKGLASQGIINAVKQLDQQTQEELNASFWRLTKRSDAGVGHFGDLN